MKKKLQIVHTGSPEFLPLLQKTFAPYHGNPSPLSDLLARLKKAPYHCQTIIFEFGYVDRDYQDEFSAFYSKSFKSYPSRTTRLHFFAAQIPTDTFFELGNYRDSYLGFLVCRPTDLQRVGRTIIQPPIQDSNREFIHCLDKFQVHILGDTFEVTGMPFVQQDTQVGACAQASLWMVSRYMGKRFGQREFLPSEINRFAKEKDARGRLLPADHGLTWTQMLNALDGMGLYAWNYWIDQIDTCSPYIDEAYPDPRQEPEDKPEVFQARQIECLLRRRKAKLASIAYRYIESGLPVIFGLTDHALVCIGHTYDHQTDASIAIQRIPEFIVHDDARGPYLPMSIFPEKPVARSFDEVSLVIAVVPKEVTLRGEEAESMAKNSAEKLLRFEVRKNGPSWKEVILAARPDLKAYLDNLEYRTYLTPSVEFQTELRHDISENRYNREVGNSLLELDYPRFVWITEISSSTLLNSSDKSRRKCIGRVIIDSTAPPVTDATIAIHFCDLLGIFDRQAKEKPDRRAVPNSTPFGHRISTQDC